MIITRKIKKHLVLLTLLIILSLMAFFSVAGVYASQSRVIDNAGLLTSDQRSALETQVNKAISVMNMDLVVLTIDDAEGKTSAAYADDYYDYNGYGTGSNKSGALILIDMDNRQIYISTTGEMINRLSDSDIESVIDSGYSRLKSGDYYGCLTKCVKSLEDKGRGNYISVMEWVISAAIAIGCGLLACLFVVRSYKMKINKDTYPYRENSTLNLETNEDAFVNTVVTTRRIETNTGGGGGGSTHVGSSGTSHGGGGRGF